MTESPKRVSIRREMSLEAICLLMSEGNREVYKLMVMAGQVDPNIILTLDTMNIRGVQAYYIFFEYCNGWFPKFKGCVLSKEQEMLDWVNKKIPYMKAVRDKTIPH